MKRIYSIWHNMKNRCYYKKCEKYKYYGGRGITVCDEWKNNFKKFHDWAINNGYKDNLSIDRIDCSLNYCPENCRWVDMEMQNNNTSKNHYIYYNGETKTASEWAKKFNIHRCVFNNRIRRGWSFEEAIKT